MPTSFLDKTNVFTVYKYFRLLVIIVLPSTDSAYLSWEVPTGPASCYLSVLLSEFCPDKNRWLTQTNKQTSTSGAHKGAVTAQHHGPLDFKPDEARLTLIHRKMQHVFHVVRFPLPSSFSSVEYSSPLEKAHI